MLYLRGKISKMTQRTKPVKFRTLKHEARIRISLLHEEILNHWFIELHRMQEDSTNHLFSTT